MSQSPAFPRALRDPKPVANPLQDPAHMRGARRPQVRRYDVTTLLPNGSVTETRHLAPALPLFEDAFCAFSRGSLVETDSGPMAIEDLLPGDRVLTVDGDPQPVIWKGRVTVVPGNRAAAARPLPLTRLMADSFGMSRPMSCLIAGPAARLLYTPDHMRAAADGAQVLTPVGDFVDGVNAIQTAPPTAVELFHICLPRHAAIRVGGLEFESYHPGNTATRTISHAMRSLFLNLFPHVDHMSEFGPLAYPRGDEGRIGAISA